MIDEIKALEAEALKLEPGEAQYGIWLNAIHEYTQQYLRETDTGKAWKGNHDSTKGLLDFKIQENARGLDELLEIIRKHVDNSGINAASGGHLAYIPGGGVYPTALGDFIAAVTNHYAGVFFGGPGAVRMENMLIRWLCDLMAYPTTALGNLTSGGSIANLIAITTARDAKGIKSTKVPQSVIYLTAQAHHSIQKAIRIAGLNECQLSYIPLDEHFRMDAQKLEAAIIADKAKGLNPFLIVGSAGTTDTGAIDPMDKMADIAEQQDLWFHVDAAYGGFFIMVDEIKAAYKGIERSDSLTIDPHKSLFLAYGTGAVLIKNVKALQDTHYYAAPYMQDTKDEVAEISPADLSPELTKHFRGMRMWLPLQLFGTKPFEAALEEKLMLCRYFYEAVQKIGFEVGPYPDLSVAIYRYVPEVAEANAFNEKLIKAVLADGRVFLSSTTIDGVFWIRLAVLSFRSHLKIIDTCLKVLEEKVGDLLEGMD